MARVILGRVRAVLSTVIATVLATVLAAALIGGCRGPKNSGQGPYADKIAETIPRLEQAVGLKFKRPPRVEMRTRSQVREFIEARFNEGPTGRELAGQEAAYKRLGMLPESLDTKALFTELLTEQIVGFYDPRTKTLYVVEGLSPDIGSVTITHELVHALQDQYLNLDSVQNADSDNDRRLAAQALLEGQATYEHILLTLGGAPMMSRLPGGWDQIRSSIRDAQGSMPVLGRAPSLVQETLIFPYLSGAEFMRAFKERRAGESPLSDVPVSTEQVLSPRAYFETRDAPTTIGLALRAGVTPIYSNNLGAFETRLLLFEHLNDQGIAVRAAAGWDGDRYTVVRTPQGDGIAWLSVWDSAIDAAEFLDALRRTIERRFGAPNGAGRDGAAVTARGRIVRAQAVEISGRPAVLWTDLPVGASPDVVDLSATTVRQ